MEIGMGTGVGPGVGTALGGEFQLLPDTEPISILPSSLIDQEDEDVQIISNPPHSRRVYMVVNDEVGNSAAPASMAHIKRKKVEAGGSARGSSSRVLPSRLRQGGSSRGHEAVEEEEEPDDEEEGNDDEDGEDGEVELPIVEAQGGSKEAPQSETQPSAVEDEDDDSLYDPTRYLKADIIELRDVAFRGDTKEARLIKGHLLGFPEGMESSIGQINKSVLFALRPPSKECKDEVQEEDEETNL